MTSQTFESEKRFNEAYVFLFEDVSKEDLDFVINQLEHYSEKEPENVDAEAIADVGLMEVYLGLTEDKEKEIDTATRYRFEEGTLYTLVGASGLYMVGEGEIISDQIPSVRKTASEIYERGLKESILY